VVPDRPLTQSQLERRFPIRTTAEHQLRDFTLARRKSIQRVNGSTGDL
jgi:hypothetical protein